MKLKKLRRQIDNLDIEIVHLLFRRIEISLLSRNLKKRVEDKKREAEIFSKIQKNYSELIDTDFLQRLYSQVIDYGKSLQEKELKLIAFQGEHGAYSEVAARLWDKNFMPISCLSFTEVFEKVMQGFCDFGVIPMENSLGGIIGEVNERLLNTDAKIVGAIDLAVSHCLLATKDTNYREIKQVYSHPQALSQCLNFVRRHKLKSIEHYDTAASAKLISQKQDKTSAAISSELAAKYYDLEILKSGIEDHQPNITRFLLIAKNPVEQENANKCSIVFSTPNSNKAGSLYNILRVFAEKGINLTRIESFPRFDKTGHFAFFVDFIGSDKDKRVKVCLEKINSQTDGFKLLGCYRELFSGQK